MVICETNVARQIRIIRQIFSSYFRSETSLQALKSEAAAEANSRISNYVTVSERGKFCRWDESGSEPSFRYDLAGGKKNGKQRKIV